MVVQGTKRNRITIEMDSDNLLTIDQRAFKEKRSRSYVVNQVLRLAFIKGIGKTR